MTLRRGPAEQSHPPAGVGSRGWVTLALVSTLAALGTLLFTAAPAFAQRTYDSQITGLRDTTAIGVNSADDVWIAYSGLISEYGPYSSHAKIGEQPTEGYIPNTIVSVAPDAATGALYVGENALIDEFGAAGHLVLPQWTFETIHGTMGGLAVDNSGGESNGVVYMGENENPFGYPTLHAFAPGKLPVDFSAHQPYINGNKITLLEVPPVKGQYAEGGISMAVDSTGNIFLLGSNFVSEFKSSGEFVRDITGSEVPGGFGEQNSLVGIAVDPTNGNLLLVDDFRNQNGEVTKSVVDEFSPTGEFIEQLTGTGPSPSEHFGLLTGAIAVNSNGYIYVADAPTQVVDIFKPKHPVPHIAYPPVSNPAPTSGTLNADVNPSPGEEVTTCHFEYGTNTSTETAFGLGELPCLDAAEHEVGTKASPITSEAEVHADVSSLTTDTTYYYRAVAGNAAASRPGLIQSFTPRAVQALQTNSATEVTATSAELNGSFVGLGEDTEYHFQYGSSTTYGETTGTMDAGEGTGLQVVEPIPITGLQPAATYHYRIVATNHSGTTYGQDRTFTTLTKPSIDGLSSSNLTSTTAVLHATINPQGADTSYHFEYGPTTSYGSTVPPHGEITDELTTDHSVEVELTGLQLNVTYHFRVVAESEYGEALSEDQTFSFHPPNCPNARLRQITNSTSLPDCRAYELVSPADAGGTSLYPAGPNSPEATNPARFAFGGFLGSIPGAGDPANTLGDLYVATRTDRGWVTKFVGFPGTQTYEANGPPDELRSDLTYELATPGGVRTDTSMNRFLDWLDGFPQNHGENLTPRSFSPHVWSADDISEGEWPTIPGSKGSPIFENSADFTHYVFQTGAAPSFSLNDDNTVTNTATEVSETAGGPIPIQPGDTTPDEESLRVPAVSSDGSHILMASRAEPLKSVMVSTEGASTDPEVPCGLAPGGRSPEERAPAMQCRLQSSVLFMRVGDATTYEVSQGHAVDYVGMTPDGSKVYFTSEEHLTGEDTEHDGASLYMWSEKGEEEHHPLTLISKGESNAPGAPGNTGNCHVLWIAACGVAPFVNNSYYEQAKGGYLGGNGLSDNSIAAKAGDIYFFSPEQLAGPRGINGQENLYDYREGAVQYVATFPPKPFCEQKEAKYCSAGPVIRMQVSPDDSYMAFLTASKVTSYDNAGHTEMYRYQTSTGEVVCVSCLPNGQPPTTDVYASSNGIFMTNDGRTFFSTGDPLVPRDTDGLRNVYEYVEGHAQLISSGTSTKEVEVVAEGSKGLFRAGLAGVSAEGTNVYFSTYDTLVGQDQNLNEIKFYDARTDGGFPYTAPAAPCEAADECHGPGSSSEAPPQSGSGAELGTGGNLAPSSTATRHKHKHRKRHHRAHRGGRR